MPFPSFPRRRLAAKLPKDHAEKSGGVEAQEMAYGGKPGVMGNYPATNKSTALPNNYSSRNQTAGA
jgi:hypothetical protein